MTTVNLSDSTYYYSFEEVKEILPADKINHIQSSSSKEFSRARMIVMIAVGSLMLLAGVFILLNTKGILHSGLNAISKWGAWEQALEVALIGGGAVTAMIGYGARQKSLKLQKDRKDASLKFTQEKCEEAVKNEILTHLESDELFVVIYSNHKHAIAYAKSPENNIKVNFSDVLTIAQDIEANFNHDARVSDKKLVSKQEMAARFLRV